MTSPTTNQRKRRKRSRRNRIGDDRISALVDPLLVHILSFLPLKEAMRTEVLSKRWLLLWTFLPKLRLHNLEYMKRDDFATFVNKTVALCSNVKKLAIHYHYEPHLSCNVNFLCRFVLRHGLEAFKLECFHDDEDGHYEEDGHYVLPQFMYSSLYLKELDFFMCKVQPVGVVSWRALKKLAITNAVLTDQVMKAILAGSPVLEFLEVNEFHGFTRLNISSVNLRKLIIRDYFIYLDEISDIVLEIEAPHLQSLDIIGYLTVRECKLGNVSSLIDAAVEIRREADFYDFEWHQSVLVGFLKSLVHVKNLRIGSLDLEVLSVLDTRGVRSPLLKCKCLTLSVGITKWKLFGIANLLGSSPDLETLVIDIDYIFSSQNGLDYMEIEDELDEFDEKTYWTTQKRVFKCLMLHLKTVKINGFLWSIRNLVLPFIKFVLTNGKVLEQMVIYASKQDEGRQMELLQVTKAILSYPRSSSSAVVKFYEKMKKRKS